MQTSLEQKTARLRQSLVDMGRVCVAFSGGVDSTYLAAAAVDALGADAVAVTFSSPIHDSSELVDAKSLAQQMGIEHQILAVDPLSIPEVSRNEPDRCYFCKNMIFSTLLSWARENHKGIVVDGTLFDDPADDRPGMRALSELGIRSPLRDAEMTKADVREASRLRGLSTHNKPAYACLATRIPYHTQLTVERLRAVERAEAALTELGFRQRRVRHHGDIARIELPREDLGRAVELAGEIDARLRACGFAYAALDLGGYRSGSMNATK